MRLTRLKSLLRGRRGQIVMPAMFVFPSLMLFVYLIFETAKLSREKIRHQFAIDAAAFVEMTNYSDFLNRTAYINGAFPMRIFTEGFPDNYTVDCEGANGLNETFDCNPAKVTRMRDLLYENNLFPCLAGSDGKCPQSAPSLDGEPQWDIGFHDSGLNSDSPSLPTPAVVKILNEKNAKEWWINWDEANQVYQVYVQIYQLLGSVEEAQYSVLKRLSDGHNFLKKSYWLNTGEAADAGGEAASAFDRYSSGFFSGTQAYCYESFQFFANQPTDETYRGWIPKSSGEPKSLPYYPSGTGAPGCANIGGQGLFQMMVVKKSELNKMREGYDVTQHWQAPGNYFGVDFNNGIRELENVNPLVHARVACGEDSSRTRPSVWPSPTPKFQVRLYP